MVMGTVETRQNLIWHADVEPVVGEQASLGTLINASDAYHCPSINRRAAVKPPSPIAMSADRSTHAGALTWSQPDESLMGPSARPWVSPAEGLPQVHTIHTNGFPSSALHAPRPPQDDGIVGSSAVRVLRAVESTFCRPGLRPAPSGIDCKLYEVMRSNGLELG